MTVVGSCIALRFPSPSATRCSGSQEVAERQAPLCHEGRDGRLELHGVSLPWASGRLRRRWRYGVMHLDGALSQFAMDGENHRNICEVWRHREPPTPILQLRIVGSVRLHVQVPRSWRLVPCLGRARHYPMQRFETRHQPCAPGAWGTGGRKTALHAPAKVGRRFLHHNNAFAKRRNMASILTPTFSPISTHCSSCSHATICSGSARVQARGAEGPPREPSPRAASRFVEYVDARLAWRRFVSAVLVMSKFLEREVQFPWGQTSVLFQFGRWVGSSRRRSKEVSLVGFLGKSLFDYHLEHRRHGSWPAQTPKL